MSCGGAAVGREAEKGMERLQQIQEIFREALQRNPAERDAFVRDAAMTRDSRAMGLRIAGENALSRRHRIRTPAAYIMDHKPTRDHVVGHMSGLRETARWSEEPVNKRLATSPGLRSKCHFVCPHF